MRLNLSRSERFLRLEGPARKRISLFLVTLIAASTLLACKIDERQSGVPSTAQKSVDTFTEDFNAARYNKIYEESADEWRTRVTLEQSNQTFSTLKERLGPIKERTYTSGRQQASPSENLPANSLVIRYNTQFERAEAIESFTLIERDGRYWLAGYSVSSNLLKQ